MDPVEDADVRTERELAREADALAKRLKEEEWSVRVHALQRIRAVVAGATTAEARRVRSR